MYSTALFKLDICTCVLVEPPEKLVEQLASFMHDLRQTSSEICCSRQVIYLWSALACYLTHELYMYYITGKMYVCSLSSYASYYGCPCTEIACRAIFRGNSRNFVEGFQNNWDYQGRFRDLWKEELISVVDLWSRESGQCSPQKL